jgi:hypothetical protein
LYDRLRVERKTWQPKALSQARGALVKLAQDMDLTPANVADFEPNPADASPAHVGLSRPWEWCAWTAWIDQGPDPSVPVHVGGVLFFVCNSNDHDRR